MTGVREERCYDKGVREEADLVWMMSSVAVEGLKRNVLDGEIDR